MSILNLVTDMKKRKQNQGFSMAELLIVVAIIVVLAGVAFVGVASHMRSMTKLEYDGYAKEIFVAAQNHLTMAAHLGYPGLSTTDNDFGEDEPDNTVLEPIDPEKSSGLTPTKEGIYYILVRNGAVSGKGAKMQALMLPTGALADGKALGGSYIIRYHKESARILDVYYWMENAGGWAGRYNHTYTDEDYEGFLNATPDGLKDYGGHVIGYYGGATAGISYKSDVKAPTVKVENGDVLRVLVTNPNSSDDVWVDLTVKGKSSGALKTFTLKKTIGDGSRVTWDSSSGKHSVMLDDITTHDGVVTNLHFAKLVADTGSPSFIPGEDLEITAVAYNTNPAPDTFSNVAYSNTETKNSLFESISKSGNTVYDTAAITHIRHLENLDNSISNVSYNGTKIAVTKAVQKNTLDFLDFKNTFDAEFTITGFNTSPSLDEESFLPVNPVYALDYDGDQNSIKNITVSGYESDAGLFGAPTGAVSVKNLMLIDFSISGTNAGALAGKLTGGSVTNVIAYNSLEKDSTFAARDNPNITGTGSVGGLIGVQSGGSVTGSAAAVYVNGATAGGFIGTMSSGTVTGCYSGGHTSGGEYKTNNYNVIGSGDSGGFVGSMTGGSVGYSYSTCSVLGGTVGGFAGSAGSISNSYCTGLVSGTSADAFAGSSSGTITGCQYFSIINLNIRSTKTGVSAFDEETADGSKTATENYSSFANGTASAVPYDPTLTAYYKGTYNLKTVTDLGYTISTGETYFVSTHYGDWPAPEIFFVNTPAS